MSKATETDHIEIHEDLPFTRREWRVQRIGWVAFGIVVALALLGVFGRGPVAHEEAGERDVFGVAFDRILRHGADAEVTITVGPGLQRTGTFRLFVSQEYVDANDISDITPHPVATGLNGNAVYYDFARDDVRSPATITFHLRPNGYWNQTAHFALVGVPPVSFSQLVLP